MRKPVLAGVAIFLVLLGTLVGVALVPPPRPCLVTKAAYGRVATGRGRAQVEQILGGPPGDYRTRPTYPAYVLSRRIYRDVRWWHGNEGLVAVTFDDAGLVALKGFSSYTEGDLIDTLRWRLKRRWEALWGR
jgi:hypothetical protein